MGFSKAYNSVKYIKMHFKLLLGAYVNPFKDMKVEGYF